MLHDAYTIREEKMVATKSEMVRARIEPRLKKSVDGIFTSLGMNASQAIVMFYQQVELHQGLPFDVRLPPKPILDMATMSDEELDAELQKGLDEVASGKGIPLAKAHASFRRRHARWSNTLSR